MVETFKPGVTSVPVAPHKKSILKRIAKDYELYLLLLPTLVFYAIFAYGPMYGLQIAFKNFNGSLGILGSPWVGFKYIVEFFKSYYFWQIIGNTFSISIYSLIAGFPIPVILALLINEVNNQRYKRFVQTVTYAPYFISTVVMVGMLMIMLSPSSGIVNVALKAIGIAPKYFMSDPAYFKHIYVWSGIWQSTGWNSVIYLAALGSVDPQQHEAAVIDGASRLQRVWYINIPVIIPTMVILFILSAGGVLNVGFEKIFLMQNDLNRDVSQVISTYIYQRGLLGADYSFSTAVGLFSNVINFILLAIVNFSARKLSDVSLF